MDGFLGSAFRSAIPFYGIIECLVMICCPEPSMTTWLVMVIRPLTNACLLLCTVHNISKTSRRIIRTGVAAGAHAIQGLSIRRMTNVGPSVDAA